MDPTALIMSKENIKPLKNGRDAAKLSTGLQALSDVDVERLLQQQRQEYETLLRDNTIEDPLSVWYEYVYWLEQCFPSQAHKARMYVVLKKCIARFKKEECVKNDERFVKLCMKYATLHDDTLETFRLLFSHGIGAKCAIFFIAWAELYVMTDSFSKAEKVYEKGISKLAEPIDLLKAEYKRFQEYHVSKMINAGETFQPTTGVYDVAPTRQVYNKIKPITLGNKEIIPSVRVLDSVSAPGTHKTRLKPKKSSNIGLQIYQDEDENGIDIDPTAKMNKVPSQKVMNKENLKKAGKWTNPDKPSVALTVPAVSMPFTVYHDEGEEEVKSTPSNILSSALKPKQHNDEFNVNYSNTHLFYPEPYDPNVRPMYRKEQVYAGGLEFQFEELRAISYRKRRVEKPPCPTPGVEVAGTTAVPATPQNVVGIASAPKEIVSGKCPTLGGAVQTTPQSVVGTALAPKEIVSGKTCQTLGSEVAGSSTVPATPSQNVIAIVPPPKEIVSGKKLMDSKEISAAKPRIMYDSGRKSLKIRTGEEARLARRMSAFPGDDSATHSARKTSSFGGVVRRTLVWDPANPNPSPLPKPDVPSDSFINQTIHTKEAVNEMQEFWFAKPPTPSTVPPPAVQVATQQPTVNFYVDESCLEAENQKPVAYAPLNVVKPPVSLSLPPTQPIFYCDEEEQDKENAVPIGYDGEVGKSMRPVTGVLTPSENIPFEPIQEEAEEEQEPDEDEENDSLPATAGNTTGITETWNFTQAFNFPRVIMASTPNVRRSIFRPPPNDDFEKDVIAGDVTEEAAAAVHQAPENLCVKDRKVHRTMGIEQRTVNEFGVKNLSVIVETSRECKSSSSGSGMSAYSKLTAFTPGPCESRTEVNTKRFYSYSQAEECTKTPFACKTQSTYGYEASAELTDAANYLSPKQIEPRISNFPAVEESQVPATKPEDVVHKLEVAGKQAMPLTAVTTALNEMQITSKCQLPTLNIVDTDPFDTKVTDQFLEQVKFPIGHHLHELHFVHSKLAPLKLSQRIQLGADAFDVKKVLGEGAYAKVYKLQNQKSGEYKVIKYQKPAFAWEFYIAREVQSRCRKDLASYFMNVEKGYFFENASLLVTAPVDFGDLLSAINLYKANQGKPMSDYLALYFTVQILEIMQELHSLKIIHGDVKPDNFLVKKLNGKLCLELIDFGRAIDMTLFPAGTSFTRIVTTEGFTCIEMQTGRPWTYQLDLYGVASCIHCLIFGEYMKVTQKAGEWQISRIIHRYQAKTGWKEVFKALLNIPSCNEMPDLNKLREDLSTKLTEYGTQPDLQKLTNFLQSR